MKSIDWLSLTRIKMSRVLGIAAVVVFAFACSDGSEDVAGPPADASAKKNALNTNTTGNCESKKEDYIISVLNEDGTPEDGASCWKYTVTLAQGAKAISHFILDLDNCPIEGRGIVPSNITSAKFNGVDWPLATSEGNGTGCDVGSTNFIKFDNLPDAQVYVFEFCTNPVFHNVLPTSVWIKAGCICHEWDNIINGPCCVF